MIVGCCKEIKNNENRVGITPGGVWVLTQAGHTVLIEKSAGSGSGFSDDEYKAKGAEIIDQSADVWAGSDMIVKVKEPLPSEYQFFRDDLILFTYLHLAPVPDLTKALLGRGHVARRGLRSDRRVGLDAPAEPAVPEAVRHGSGFAQVCSQA